MTMLQGELSIERNARLLMSGHSDNALLNRRLGMNHSHKDAINKRFQRRKMMKTRNRFSSALMLGALVVGLVAVAAIWNAIPASAIGEVEGRPQFGVISLASGQTARLNVVNTRAIDPEDATSGDGSVRKV